jgi:hypothetical protein
MAVIWPEPSGNERVRLVVLALFGLFGGFEPLAGHPDSALDELHWNDDALRHLRLLRGNRSWTIGRDGSRSRLLTVTGLRERFPKASAGAST